MLYLIVYAYAKGKHAAIMTDDVSAFPSAIFSVETKGLDDKEADEKARTKATKLGLGFVQGLDKVH
jgi:hypothetical protein